MLYKMKNMQVMRVQSPNLLLIFSKFNFPVCRLDKTVSRAGPEVRRELFEPTGGFKVLSRVSACLPVGLQYQVNYWDFDTCYFIKHIFILRLRENNVHVFVTLQPPRSRGQKNISLALFSVNWVINTSCINFWSSSGSLVYEKACKGLKGALQ